MHGHPHLKFIFYIIILATNRLWLTFDCNQFDQTETSSTEWLDNFEVVEITSSNLLNCLSNWRGISFWFFLFLLLIADSTDESGEC